MNQNIAKLYQIASQPNRKIIGLMSGTSMDGLDIALCDIIGSGKETRVRLEEFETIEYSEEIKIEIRKVFAQKTIDFQQLVVLNEWIGNLHAEMILKSLKKWNINTNEIDLIASHGQTVFHAPKTLHQQEKFPNATLQIGDGDHIAVKTGIITVSDFRQKHVAAGGEGAPLAVYGDYFLFSKENENRIMLNIGGISNFTFLPGNQNADEIFVTDTGTGNTLMDAFVRLHFPGKSYDKDAQIAKTGTTNIALLKALKENEFFKGAFPKSTGPELFNLDYLKNALEKSNTTLLSVPDILATLTLFSAQTIADAVHYILNNASLGSEKFTVYLSGGGMHNPLLFQFLQELLPCDFKSTDNIGISGDAKEALLFAVLANETLAGGTTQFSDRNKIPSICMGKISFPN